MTKTHDNTVGTALRRIEHKIVEQIQHYRDKGHEEEDLTKFAMCMSAVAGLTKILRIIQDEYKSWDLD